MVSAVRPSVLLFVLVSSIAAVAAASACSADVKAAPDVPEQNLCDPGKPIIPCDAGPPNVLEACTGDPKSSTDARNMPLDKSYPVGCRSYFPARDCSPISNCYCREDDTDGGSDAGTTAHWICER